MYVQASYGNYDGAWAHLSSRLQGEKGSPQQWVMQQGFNDLRYVYFTQYPKAQVSGDTAEVEFQVQETHDGSTRLTSGIWQCLNEGGEWKLDSFIPTGETISPTTTPLPGEQPTPTPPAPGASNSRGQDNSTRHTVDSGAGQQGGETPTSQSPTPSETPTSPSPTPSDTTTSQNSTAPSDTTTSGAEWETTSTDGD
jgi:hypothetical protein